jgi:hypothetical protein
MSSLFARLNAIVPIVATVTLLGKEGYFYKLDASNQAIAIAAVTDIPDGLIGMVKDSDGLEISALKQGGNHGTVKVKLGADVTDLRKDLTLRADGSVESDDGSGARVVVARPLETGVATELIEAVLIPARKIGAAVALGSTNGTAGAAADLAALKAETELLGDDVRAMHAALVTAGYLA